MNTNLTITVYKAVLYLRISREDGDKDESDSITNQRDLILNFLKSHPEIQIYEIRIDDGYSGVNFERPGFKQMMNDIRSGNANCIIVKDLSRFGRNHIEVGKYTEKIFPHLGVRFIAVNDNVDSIQNEQRGNDIIVPFKNLINDAYSRDISIKIRSNLETKRRRGDFVGAFAPYGYRKSEDNKNKLEIDEEAAQVVRNIFSLYLQGYSAYKIAEYLNDSDVLTPMDYKRKNGSCFYTGFRNEQIGKWKHIMILRILSNPVYTGTLVQGKNTTPNYKVRKKIQKDKSKWNEVENTHDPIISINTFRNVQKVLKTDTRTGNSEEMLYCLAGIVKCGDCGANMIRKTVPSGNKKYVYYICSGHKGNRTVCSPHNINAEVLEKSILKILNCQICMVLNMETLLEKVKDIQCRQKVAARWEKQITSKQEEIRKYCNLKIDLYEDLKAGLLSKDEYDELKAVFEQRMQMAENALKLLQKEAELGGNGKENFCEWIGEFKKYGILEHLTREVVVSLLEEVLVYEKKKGERYPRIEVRFKYSEELEMTVNLLGDLKLLQSQEVGAHG